VICDQCGEDRVRERMLLLAFPRAGWPPLRLAHVCPGCREELRGGMFYRFLFLLSCLALVVAVAGAGVGIVYLIQWLIRLSSS
jgi:hypothetical protein